MKTTSRAEKKHYAFESAPRCGARTKGNQGKPCRCPAVRGKARCRVHGGARGSGARIGNTNALKHGATTIESKTFKTELRQLLRHYKNVLKKFS
ncbi:TPA: hypothetical protein U0Z67_000827 [Legionella pneumophila]|nr:hypothetical protein [Legionella pneumophila]